VTMHVAVAGWLLGEPSGANTRLLALLANVAPQLEADERVTVLHRPEYVPPALAGIAWHPVPIPAGPTLARVRAERTALPRALRDLGATVLDHGFLPLPRVAIPTVLLVHDVRGADGFARWPRWLARAVLRRSCTRAAAIVTPSAWTAARVAALAPDAPPAVVVCNGVDAAPPPPDHGPAPGPPLPAVPPTGYVLHVGHVEPRKNLRVVVAALARLPAGARPELWLVGRDAGALRALQRRAAPAGVAVRAFGVLAPDRLAAAYRAARAVVVPSRHEGFGLPVLEALAHGTRVLTSDAGALPEVGGGLTGVLPADDTAAWARALTAPPAAPTAAARAAHLARFRWHDAAGRLLAVWRRVSG
jgi:glycosyltransferase involved in cell wall biosynthesis